MGKTAAVLICALAVAAVSVTARNTHHKRSQLGRSGGRIVGGEDAELHQIPSIVSFQWRVPFGSGFTHWCGGSVLDENTVLTAAHCCDGFTPDDLRMVAGDHDLTDNEGSEQERFVTEIVIHEDYGTTETAGLAGGSPVNDICLLRLQEPYELIPGVVEAIQLTDSDRAETGPVTIAGWGALASGGSSPDILQFVESDLVSDEQCQTDYSLASGRILLPILPDEMICAARDGIDTCQGDSGGPMFCSDGRQCGITSFG